MFLFLIIAIDFVNNVCYNLYNVKNNCEKTAVCRNSTTQKGMIVMAAVKQNSAVRSDFFTYKGYPLVRCNDTIYYGNMYDKFVIMMMIIEKEKVNGLEMATKIRVCKMATDEKLNPIEAIVKNTECDSLYNALTTAYTWLNM